jgi:hypothetical protein
MSCAEPSAAASSSLLIHRLHCPSEESTITRSSTLPRHISSAPSHHRWITKCHHPLETRAGRPSFRHRRVSGRSLAVPTGEHFLVVPYLSSTPCAAHPCYKQCCSERGSRLEVFVKMLLVLGIRNPQSTACEVGALVPRIKCKSLLIFLFLTWYYFCIHLYVTICMKLDPDTHIGLHLVFFGKIGVPQWYQSCIDCRT